MRIDLFTSDITDDKFIPSNDPDASFVWKFEKASSVKNKIEYAYFSDNEQKSKEIDTLAIQSYYLVYEKNGVKYGLKKATDYSLVKLNDGDVKLMSGLNSHSRRTLMVTMR